MRASVGGGDDGTGPGYHARARRYAQIAAAAFDENAVPPERVQAAAAVSVAYSALAQTRAIVAAANRPWWRRLGPS